MGWDVIEARTCFRPSHGSIMGLQSFFSFVTYYLYSIFWKVSAEIATSIENGIGILLGDYTSLKQQCGLFVPLLFSDVMYSLHVLETCGKICSYEQRQSTAWYCVCCLRL